MNQRSVFGPGSTVGVLGGGQLGRMFAMAARRLGYRVHTLVARTRHAHRADRRRGNQRVVRRPRRGQDICTGRRRRDLRVRECVGGRCCSRRGARCRPAERSRALRRAASDPREIISGRTRSAGHAVRAGAHGRRSGAGGWSGRHPRRAENGCIRVRRQRPGWRFRRRTELPGAWESLGRQESILEAFIDLEREISVIGARGVDGSWSHFGPIDNAHRHHILDVSVAPSTVARIARGRRPSR